MTGLEDRKNDHYINGMWRERKCIEKCQNVCKKLDVMVKPEQRIGEVYKRFSENGFLPAQPEDGQMSVYSLRRKEYLDETLTFWQDKIYAGDVLVFCRICPS